MSCWPAAEPSLPSARAARPTWCGRRPRPVVTRAARKRRTLHGRALLVSWPANVLMRGQGRLDDALAYFRNAAQAGGARAAVYMPYLRKDATVCEAAGSPSRRLPEVSRVASNLQPEFARGVLPGLLGSRPVVVRPGARARCTLITVPAGAGCAGQ